MLFASTKRFGLSLQVHVSLFYKLNGFNDPTLKHVFVASLLKELPPELQRQVNLHQLDISNLSFGKIYQLAVSCLERLCEQKEFFKDLMENRQPFKSACKKPHLKIKCKDEKDCTCSLKKKSHFKKVSSKTKSYSGPKKPYRFFKRKDPFSSQNPENSRCFICKKKGQFTKNSQISRQSRVVFSITYKPLLSSLYPWWYWVLVFRTRECNEETIFALEETYRFCLWLRKCPNYRHGPHSPSIYCSVSYIHTLHLSPYSPFKIP